MLSATRAAAASVARRAGGARVLSTALRASAAACAGQGWRPAVTARSAGVVTALPSAAARLLHVSAAVDDLRTITVPSLGDSVPDATLSEIETPAGTGVDVDDIVAILETDKVSVELRTDVAGVVAEFLVAEGDTVNVGAEVCRIDTSASAPAAQDDDAAASSSSEEAAAAAPAADEEEEDEEAPAAAAEEIDVPIPNLGDSIVDGTLSMVLTPGTTVAMDEVVAEIDTDKVTAEMRAPTAGTIVTVYAEEGDTVNVGDNLFRLAPSEGGAAAAASPSATEAPATAEAEATGTAAADSSAAAAPSSAAAAHGARVPLIRFRHGKRDAMPAAAAPAAPTYTPSAAVVSQEGTGSLAVTVLTVGSFLDLPPMFGRPPMSDAEMDLIDTGGAEAF